MNIDKVWSGHPVGFDFITYHDAQYAAYYNAERQMVIASRQIGEATWTYQLLPSSIQWDSHNYITMAFDQDGFLHVSGNMHVDPLVYFRSEKPRDITTLQAIHFMTGKDETRVTYPRFLYNNDNELLFMYRNGVSGNGHRYINRYSERTKTWSRYLYTPLLDGQNHDMNAYPADIQKGNDGWFHLLWMWRDTPDCSSNHDLSYARSKDLIHWESIDGNPLTLPITPEQKNTVVDSVPPRMGLINMGFGYSFDHHNQILIHYHKYDDMGNSQIYIAKRNSNQWEHHQISRWNYRWEFSGGGSIPCEVKGFPVKKLTNGNLAMSWSHSKYGSGAWELDVKSLDIVGDLSLEESIPTQLAQVESKLEGMQVHIQSDRGKHFGKDSRYIIRWETLTSNRDRQRDGELPDPSPLKLIEISQ